MYTACDGRIAMDHKHAIHFRDRKTWQRWLERNHDKETEVWLLHYKKHSGRTGVRHEEAVEEAICYGWIDSKLRSVDEEKYALKYSPRRKGSVWSEINKRTALAMIDKGKMTKAGMARIQEAKSNGKWASAYSSKARPPIPKDLAKALAGNRLARENFHRLPNSHKTQYVFWIQSAKREDTRKKRIETAIQRSSVKNASGR